MIWKEMILDARDDENGNLKDEDLEELQNYGDKMVRMSNKDSEAMYKRYQNLWHDYVRRKKIKEYIALMAFFNSIKTKYDAITLWVIYSYINSYMIDQHGSNLRSLVRLIRHLKMETSHYVSKKSRTFSAEQIHEVIAHCMDKKIYDPKKTHISVCIAIMYDCLLRMKEAFL